MESPGSALETMALAHPRNKGPLFSVVIPTYNQADLLSVALRSVLQQTFQDFQAIVIDNFSTDGTARVLEQFEAEDKRIKTVHFANHGVIGASRNVGIQASSGRYIAFLDSDDTWYPRKLEMVAQVLDDHPEVRCICHDEHHIKDGKVIRRVRSGPRNHSQADLFDYLLFERNCLTTSATALDARLLQETGGFSENPRYATVEDYELWLRVARVSGTYFLHEPLSQFRVHALSTSLLTRRNWLNTVYLLRDQFAALPASQAARARGRINRRYAAAWLAVAYNYATVGEPRGALRHYVKAVAASPLHWKVYASLPLLAARWMGRGGGRHHN